MKTITTISEAGAFIDAAKGKGRSIGFVPTMGALHEGHLALMDRAGKENDLLVVSVFVNPIQFNNPDDLKNYPRDLQSDAQKLESVECDLLFAPSAEEMYPDEEVRKFDFGSLEYVMEGKFRPGHFNGVAVVVDKLFRIIRPNRAYFGQKDFQQLAIIRRLVETESHRVEVVACPTVREPDGLAMSSRNLRLTDDERKEAPFIHQMLMEAYSMAAKHMPPAEIVLFVTNAFEKHEVFRLEYFEIVDTSNLQTIRSWDEAPQAIGCIAAYLGNIRLIDNMILFSNFAAAN
jgi:pantoate--beta-alanine ligase